MSSVLAPDVFKPYTSASYVGSFTDINLDSCYPVWTARMPSVSSLVRGNVICLVLFSIVQRRGSFFSAVRHRPVLCDLTGGPQDRRCNTFRVGAGRRSAHRRCKENDGDPMRVRMFYRFPLTSLTASFKGTRLPHLEPALLLIHCERVLRGVHGRGAGLLSPSQYIAAFGCIWSYFYCARSPYRFPITPYQNAYREVPKPIGVQA